MEERADESHSEIHDPEDRVQLDEALKWRMVRDQCTFKARLSDKEIDGEKHQEQKRGISNGIQFLPAGKVHDPVLLEGIDDDEDDGDGEQERGEEFAFSRKKRESCRVRCHETDDIGDKVPFRSLLPFVEYKVSDRQERREREDPKSNGRD